MVISFWDSDTISRFDGGGKKPRSLNELREQLVCSSHSSLSKKTLSFQVNSVSTKNSVSGGETCLPGEHVLAQNVGGLVFAEGGGFLLIMESLFTEALGREPFAVDLAEVSRRLISE